MGFAVPWRARSGSAMVDASAFAALATAFRRGYSSFTACRHSRGSRGRGAVQVGARPHQSGAFDGRHLVPLWKPRHVRAPFTRSVQLS